MHPKIIEKCPYRKERSRFIDTQKGQCGDRGDGRVRTEAEIGVGQPPAQESPDLPEAGRDDKFSPQAFGRSVVLLMP